jgi:hypothetical protein
MGTLAIKQQEACVGENRVAVAAAPCAAVARLALVLAAVLGLSATIKPAFPSGNV